MNLEHEEKLAISVAKAICSALNDAQASGTFGDILINDSTKAIVRGGIVAVNISGRMAAYSPDHIGELLDEYATEVRIMASRVSSHVTGIQP